MGEFELKTTVEKRLKPDKITLIAGILVVDKDKQAVKNTVYKELERINKQVSELNLDIKIIYTNSIYNEIKDTFSKSTILGNKEVTNTSFKGTFDLNIVISSVEYNDEFKSKLSKIVEIINESEYIYHLGYNTELSSAELVKLELKNEVGKTCREEAESIISGLGFKIKGIKTVLYNTTGYLCNKDTNKKIDMDDFGDYGDCDDMWECEESSTLDFDTDKTPNINKSYANNIVEGIMQEEITITDSITVLFIVGE